MLVIAGGRGQGKTLKLIQKSEETNLPILCRCEYERKRIKYLSLTNGYKIPEPVLFGEGDAAVPKRVLIDDYEATVKELLSEKGFTLCGYTYNTDDFFREVIKV